MTCFNVLFQNLSGRYKENHRKPLPGIADLSSENQNRSSTYEAERSIFLNVITSLSVPVFFFPLFLKYEVTSLLECYVVLTDIRLSSSGRVVISPCS